MSAHDSSEASRERNKGKPDKAEKKPKVDKKRPLVRGERWDQGMVLEFLGIDDRSLQQMIEAGLEPVIPFVRRHWFNTDDIMDTMDRMSAANKAASKGKGEK